MTAVHTPAECIRIRRRTRAFAIVAAVGATFTVWAIADPLAGVDLVVDTGSGRTTVTLLAVVLMTVVAGLVAWGTLAVVERINRRRAAAVWSGIAGLALLISLVGPIGSAVGGGATLVLVVMHLVVGAVLIPVMARSSA